MTRPLAIITNADGDVPLYPQLGNDVTVIAQACVATLQVWRGDNPRKAADGIPYLDLLSMRPVPVDALRDMARDRLLSVAGVADVRAWASIAKGTVEVGATVTTDDGEQVQLSSDLAEGDPHAGAGHDATLGWPAFVFTVG